MYLYIHVSLLTMKDATHEEIRALIKNLLIRQVERRAKASLMKRRYLEQPEITRLYLTTENNVLKINSSHIIEIKEVRENEFLKARVAR